MLLAQRVTQRSRVLTRMADNVGKLSVRADTVVVGRKVDEAARFQVKLPGLDGLCNQRPQSWRDGIVSGQCAPEAAQEVVGTNAHLHPGKLPVRTAETDWHREICRRRSCA